MSEQEKKNCPEYQAGKAAAEWWQTLSEEQRKQMDIVDAFAYGVLHGWNNPNWIPVEEMLPQEQGKYMFRLSNGDMYYETYYPNLKLFDNVTHWMEILPPRKEANND